MSERAESYPQLPEDPGIDDEDGLPPPDEDVGLLPPDEDVSPPPGDDGDASLERLAEQAIRRTA